ncbi:hypothetical protein CEUSTIGMA_g4458.t1 [Chlamydomonas eustigma]|uniref:Serine aminopeptidase S33 domain-containing protein n=1 Tax=Chlamydomonas eustigma TaxID=1157962 RepID=A0A250X1R0_9CHLO|nr:hypothetical protein CEUSTIGMA_g4458.t1 [Chlamydomonas eustigma]|eukprot:GAX77011.1 hypothetical protein CEUSTIGMA_g4458.t1 [Chlamydomonas eustigma]
MIDGAFTNSRGITPFKRSVLPPDRNSSAVVIFHHGFTDHCARHLHVLTPLADAGCILIGFDAYGHGRTGPASPWFRSYIRDFNELVKDFIEFTVYVRGQNPGLPIYSMGHSMGGTIVALAACRRPELYSGVILSSPLVQVIPKSVKSYLTEWVAWGMNWVVPGLSYLRIIKRQPIERGMNDEAAVKAMKTDPYWDPLPHRFGSVCSLLQAARMLQAEAPTGLSAMPLFIQQGTTDVATKAEWLLDFLQRRLNLTGTLNCTNPADTNLRSKGYYIGERLSEAGERNTLSSERNVTLFVVDGGFHDLIHDNQTPQCLDKLVEWVKIGIGKGKN